MNEKIVTVESDIASVKPARRRWWRYSLRTFLVLVTVFCVWLGIVANRARSQKQTVESLLKLGDVWVWYDYQIDEYSHARAELRSYVPRWVMESLGTDFFHTVVEVNIRQDTKFADADLEIVSRFKDLKKLAIVSNKNITHDGLQHLKNLIKLECLILNGSNLDSSGLAHTEKLQSLTQLSLNQTNVDDEGLKSIGKFRNLKILMLARCPITDRGMKYLKPLTALEFLEIVDTSITDEGIKHLAEIKSLKRIWLQKSKVTMQGQAWLQKQLPNCEILGN